MYDKSHLSKRATMSDSSPADKPGPLYFMIQVSSGKYEGDDAINDECMLQVVARSRHADFPDRFMRTVREFTLGMGLPDDETWKYWPCDLSPIEKDDAAVTRMCTMFGNGENENSEKMYAGVDVAPTEHPLREILAVDLDDFDKRNAVIVSIQQFIKSFLETVMGMHYGATSKPFFKQFAAL
jgi:hypothetical protein